MNKFKSNSLDDVGKIQSVIIEGEFGVMEKKWRKSWGAEGFHVIEFHRIDRLLSNLRHNARAQSASVTRNKQGCAGHEVCIAAQSIGDPGQLAIKPETRCPVVDHARWSYVSTRIGTVIVSFVSSIIVSLPVANISVHWKFLTSKFCFRNESCNWLRVK